MARKQFPFSRGSRLSRSKDLQNVLKNGKRVRSEHLELRGLASHSRSLRIGVIVPKHRHLVVERNRLKRKLREAIRLHILPGPDNLEVVIKAAPSAYGVSTQELTAELIRGMKKLISAC